MQRVPPRKARFVIDQVRGMRAIAAMNMLTHVPNKAAEIVKKLIKSAMANAVENHNLNEEDLVVTEIYADGGPTLKRIKPRAMGRANRILKRTSHIGLIVEDIPEVAKPKQPARKKPAKLEPIKVAAVAAPVVEEAPAVEEATAVEEAPVEAVAEEATEPAAEAVEEPKQEEAETPAAEGEEVKEE